MVQGGKPTTCMGVYCLRRNSGQGKASHPSPKLDIAFPYPFVIPSITFNSTSKEANTIFMIPTVLSRFLLIQFNRDRKSTRLNSSHVSISYAVFCLKKKI